MTETEMLTITLTGAEIGALLDLVIMSPCEYTQHQTAAVMKLSEHFRELSARGCRRDETDAEAPRDKQA